ncbi:hypothetical protein D8674_008758 [Pyrus ussuriensis x Pyrus communis]|uniref:F-box protein n=1 Tax=Pyrus ussuriensis x Pyrus communis TaxID=2448454 RepID=A0A5N5HU97_9ROSA|nr:hypothetical protein D8674_008758 [Pyrus ussuriensis x Pyrus communis]
MRRSNLLSLLLCWCEDSLFNVLCRLSQRDLVKCKMVSKSWQWHRIISRVWLRMFWPRSPTVGLFYRTIHPCDGMYQLLSLVYLYAYPFFKSPEPSPPLLDWGGELCRWQRRDFSDNLRDSCNGLLLLFNPTTYQFCVSNPITKQHASIPLPVVEAEEADFCAALAYDPVESDHYRVVRISYFHSQQQPTSITTTTPMDIFSSHSRQWVRHGLRLDPTFVEGFKRFKLCRKFFYLRGVLYSLATSGKILLRSASDVKYNEHLDTLVPFAISPNSHVLFFGTRKLIFRYDLESRRKLKLLLETGLNIAVPGYHFPCFTLRACLMPFYGLDHAQKSVGSPFPAAQEVSKGAKILSAERACQCDTEKDSWIGHVDSYFIHKDRRPFFYPSEMQLCAGMEEMELPKPQQQIQVISNEFVKSFLCIFDSFCERINLNCWVDNILVQSSLE